MKKTFIQDSKLGSIVVYDSPRSKRFLCHIKRDAIYIALPPGGTLQEAKVLIERYREELLEKRRQLTPTRINLNYHIDREFFRLSLVQGEKNQFLANTRPGMMQVVCPPNTNFDDEQLQTWLRKVIEEALRQNAKRVLPARLEALSTQYRLPYKGVKIKSSRGRWGSCSTQKEINLSFFLLLLPPHLIDYVLLHELCHTKEMNHGPRFWTLLDEVTGGRARALRKELRGYRPAV